MLPGRSFVSSLALAGGAFLAILASCSVGDQVCPSDWLVTDTNGPCPYGPPGGPQKKNTVSECMPITFDKTSCATHTFENDVYPVFTKCPTTNPNCLSKCTTSGCHGTQQDAERAKGLYFPPNISAADLYTTLSHYANPQGQPYWGGDQKTAWVLCNLLASPGGGSPMPKPGGLTDMTQQANITKWVTCGMNPPGSGTGGAGSTSSSTGSTSSTGTGG